jgi:tRNA (cmo5U34)-methyltransferase
MQDQYFAHPMEEIRPFSFNEDVARVFDDMVSRSIPFYHEIHRIILDLLTSYAQNGDVVYDLGCSTGTTIVLMDQHLRDLNVKFVGLDSSPFMVKKATEKIWQHHITRAKIMKENVLDFKLEKCGVVIMNYTLQFIEPEKRQALLNKIYESLRPGGILIMTEKILPESEAFRPMIRELYDSFKRRNGYSELEISQKRQALENVLIPQTPQEHYALLKGSGFARNEMLFRWFNFACFLAQKN